MYRISINAIASLSVLMALSACATHKERLLPHGESPMLDVWNQNTSAPSDGARVNRQLLDARQALRRPLVDSDALTTQSTNAAHTRTASNEIYRQFQRLPNPDLVMYVFPHLAGSDPSPVPGYSTVFPLYRHVQYAMPGERTEDY